VSWPDDKVSVNLTRQAVKDAPPYDAAVQLDRKQESRIYEYYGRPGYWENGE
jgi:spore germination protein YaaH